MVAPEEACLNLQRLAAEGFDGHVTASIEAIDYTPVAAAARAVERGGPRPSWPTTRA